MSRHAPLYVECLDLAQWLHEHATGDASPSCTDLWLTILKTSRDLLGTIVLALTFPNARDAERQSADHLATRLRALIPLAAALGLMSPAQRRHAMGRIQTIGRMIGGWQRTPRKRRKKSSQEAEAPRL